MVKPIQRKDVIINRVRRFPFVVFLKRISPILIFILILILTFLFGLWDVRKFNYIDSELKNIKVSELDKYLSKYKGRNIFTLRIKDIEDTLFNSNGYVRDIYIKKVLPSRLDITIYELTPLYMGYSSDRCLLFADNGEVISEVCKECELECVVEDEGMIMIKSDSILESNNGFIYFEEIDSIQRVLSEYGYYILDISINDGIVVLKDREGHTFTFDITYELEVQLARAYVVCQKIDSDMIKFNTLDLRFERPIMR